MKQKVGTLKRLHVSIDYENLNDLQTTFNEIKKQMRYLNVDKNFNYNYIVSVVGEYREEIINGKLCFVIGSKLNND